MIMKLTRPIFTLRPYAFQVYCYLLKKLESMPEAHQKTRTIICSKAELCRELGASINTVRQALDRELEQEFRFIKKLPNEFNKSENRIYINSESEWNWDLIREIIKASYIKNTKSEDASIFDDLSISDRGSE